MVPAAEPLLAPATMAAVAAVVEPVTTLWLVTVMPVVALELVVVTRFAVALVPHSRVAACDCALATRTKAKTPDSTARMSFGTRGKYERNCNTPIIHQDKNLQTQLQTTQKTHGFIAVVS